LKVVPSAFEFFTGSILPETVDGLVSYTKESFPNTLRLVKATTAPPPGPSVAQREAHRAHLERSCSDAMVIGTILFALNTVEPWLRFNHDLTVAKIQLGVAIAIACIFSMSLTRWGQRRKLGVFTVGLFVGTAGFEWIVLLKDATNTAYSDGFPVLFGFYAVLIPASLRQTSMAGIVVMLLLAVPEFIYKQDPTILVSAVTANFTSFAILLYGRHIANRLWEREFIARERVTYSVSNISHRVQRLATTLSVLSAQLASGSVVGDLKLSEHYKILHRVSDELEGALKNLRVFAQLKDNAVLFRFSVIDPDEFVEKVVREFENALASEGRRVNLSVTGTAPFISADPHALRSILWNLLENAVKYSPNCDSVDVRVRPVARRFRRPRFVAIEIQDHGIGIPLEEQRLIFEPTVRGEYARLHNIEGDGIGLGIVQHMMAAHTGTVDVASAVGTGSTFTCYFPVSRS